MVMAIQRVSKDVSALLQEDLSVLTQIQQMVIGVVIPNSQKDRLLFELFHNFLEECVFPPVLSRKGSGQ